jgi:hypothetical protein
MLSEPLQWHGDLDAVHVHAELNKGKRNHGLPKGVTRRPNSTKLECKVHMDGKRFYVGLFNTVQEALEAQAQRKRDILEAAERNPARFEMLGSRTLTGEEEIEKVRRAQAEGAPLEKACASFSPAHHSTASCRGLRAQRRPCSDLEHRVSNCFVL